MNVYGGLPGERKGKDTEGEEDGSTVHTYI
jgi:hypothetical protein